MDDDEYASLMTNASICLEVLDRMPIKMNISRDAMRKLMNALKQERSDHTDLKRAGLKFLDAYNGWGTLGSAIAKFRHALGVDRMTDLEAREMKALLGMEEDA